MNLGRVIGTVVATRKYEGLEGVKLLLVQPLDHAQKKVGDPIVAADTVRAGSGELIYFVNSREAALALDPWFVPVDAAIVGIVDDVDAGNADTAEPHRAASPAAPGPAVAEPRPPASPAPAAAPAPSAPAAPAQAHAADGKPARSGAGKKGKRK
ncbi:MAG: EutN/CcmL family microcompartment protein [Polyangia bacterium]